MRAGGVESHDAQSIEGAINYGARIGIAAPIAKAIKASGVVVRVEPEDFAKILRKVEKRLIVYTQGSIFSTNHQYLTSFVKAKSFDWPLCIC